MSLCRGMTREQIEAQYFLRALRPDYETTMLPGWLERSSRFVAANAHRLDLEYADTPRGRLDYFPGNEGHGPFVLYVHGGYWQRGDKSVYRFVAEPLVAQGISVALVNYDMCPNVRMAEIPNGRFAVQSRGCGETRPSSGSVGSDFTSWVIPPVATSPWR